MILQKDLKKLTDEDLALNWQQHLVNRKNETNKTNSEDNQNSEFELELKQYYKEFYDRYYTQLYSFARYLGLRKGLVSDAIQNLLIKLTRYLYSYQPNKLFRPWLFSVYRNVVYDTMRQSSNDKVVFTDNEELESTATISNMSKPLSGEQAYDQVDAKVDIEKINERLTPKEKELLYMRYYTGLDTSAIAEELGEKYSTVYKRVLSILNKCRVIAEEMGIKSIFLSSLAVFFFFYFK